MDRANTVGTFNGARQEMELNGWHVVRTLRGGTPAMRKARETYTPMTDGEKKDVTRYNRRLLVSTLRETYDQRVADIASLPFQKAPTIEGDLPEPLDRIVEDADRKGTSLASFLQQIHEDAIDRGMGLFLVDNVPTDVPDETKPADLSGNQPTRRMSLPETDEIDARPYFVRIAPDNLVGFTTESRHGRDVVTELRYREWTWRKNQDGTDEFVERVRVWTEATVEVWEATRGQTSTVDREKDAAKATGQAYQIIEPARPHGYPGIPLCVHYTKELGTLTAKPPLLGLAWLNIAHWQRNSRHDDALEYCLAPILKASGVTHEMIEQQPQLGSGAVAASTSDSFDLAYVEIAGSSLQSNKEQIVAYEQAMDQAGMQPMLSMQGPATATGEVRADMANKSQAQTWVERLEWVAHNSFKMAAKWLSQVLPEDFGVTLFKDSSLIAGKATDIPTITGLASQGKLSLGTCLAEIKARGVLVTVEDIEEEVEKIREEAEEAVQRQMDAFASRMIEQRGEGEGGGGGPPGLPREDEEEKDDEGEGDDE